MFICIPLIQHTMLLKMVSSEKNLGKPILLPWSLSPQQCTSTPSPSPAPLDPKVSGIDQTPARCDSAPGNLSVRKLRWFQWRWSEVPLRQGTHLLRMPQERWWLLHIGWTWQCFILVKSIVILVASPLSLVKTQELCQLLIVLARRSTSFTEQSAPLKPIKQVQCPVTLLQSPDRLYHSGRVLKSSFHVSALWSWGTSTSDVTQGFFYVRVCLERFKGW